MTAPVQQREDGEATPPRVASWAASQAASRAASLALLFGLALLSAPLSFLAHESGHLLTARMFGAEAILHHDAVELHGDEHWGKTEKVVSFAAGPAVDWVVGLAALLLLVRRYSPVWLVLAIWVARPLQFVPALLGLDAILFGGAGLEDSDEDRIAELIGVLPETLVSLELAAAVPLLGLIVWAIPAAARLTAIPVMTIGVVLGWAVWERVGPYVLP